MHVQKRGVFDRTICVSGLLAISNLLSYLRLPAAEFLRVMRTSRRAGFEFLSFHLTRLSLVPIPGPGAMRVLTRLLQVGALFSFVQMVVWLLFGTVFRTLFEKWFYLFISHSKLQSCLSKTSYIPTPKLTTALTNLSTNINPHSNLAAISVLTSIPTLILLQL